MENANILVLENEFSLLPISKVLLHKKASVTVTSNLVKIPREVSIRSMST